MLIVSISSPLSIQVGDSRNPIQHCTDINHVPIKCQNKQNFRATAVPVPFCRNKTEINERFSNERSAKPSSGSQVHYELCGETCCVNTDNSHSYPSLEHVFRNEGAKRLSADVSGNSPRAMVCNYRVSFLTYLKIRRLRIISGKQTNPTCLTRLQSSRSSAGNEPLPVYDGR